MHSSPPAQSLPVVVSVGFAGSRQLLPPTSALDENQQEQFHAQIARKLAEVLGKLPADLDLSLHHFLCGISQVAIGGDLLFGQACAAVPIPHRIFLPQSRDEFLAATSAGGVPDFPEKERQLARELLASPHVIHQQVVSDSSDRTARFEDANIAILRASDVVLCLLRLDAESKPGGTAELLEHARILGKPALEIRVSERDGNPEFIETWHRPAKPWTAPQLPEEIRGAQRDETPTSPSPGVPMRAAEFLDALNHLGDGVATWKRRLFKSQAFTVIGAHLLATLCALIALKLHPEKPSILLPSLLGIEVILLLAGFWVHHLIHHSHLVRVWATSRLTAEIARSVGSLRAHHVHLDYLFTLPFPESLQPLLRTVNVLHLASSKESPSSWQEERAHYLARRLDGPEGQIRYYTTKLAESKGKLRFATRLFHLASITAILATGTKLALILAGNTHPPSALGVLAILLPVVAVGALSLAASFDLEARVHTYQEMVDYLTSVRPLFDSATTERAFAHLMLRAEYRLLGETVNWFSRRSFTSVT